MQVDLVLKNISLNEARDLLMKLGIVEVAPRPSVPVLLPPSGGSVPVPQIIQPAAPAPVVDPDLAELAAANPAASTEVAANAVPSVDATGLPWDERIHSGSKSLTSKGVWQKRRGIQEPLIKQVEAELRARGGQAAPVQAHIEHIVAQPAPAPQPAAPQPISPALMFPQPTAIPQQPAPVDPRIITPAPAPQPTAPQYQPVEDFNSLMATVQNLFNNQQITPEYMMQLNGKLGVVAITDIANDPTRVGQAFQMLRQDGKIQ